MALLTNDDAYAHDHLVLDNGEDYYYLVSADSDCEHEGTVHNPVQLTFSPQVYGSSALRSLVVGDLNGDTFPDIVIGDSSTVTCYFNDGTAQFTLSQTFPDSMVQSLLLLDVDNDEDLDLIASFSSKTSLYRNDGTGQFVFDSIITSEKMESMTRINNDHDADFDFIGATNNKILLFMNDGNAHFIKHVIDTAGQVSRLVAFDLDNDGMPDLAAATNDGVNIYLNDGMGSLDYQSCIPLGNIQDMSIADLNNNGFPDLIVTYAQGTRVYLNNGDGKFFEYDREISSTNTRCAYSADFDNDGLNDMTLGLTNKTVIYQNQEYGNFVDRGITFPELKNVWVIKGSDFDDDGDIDLITGISGQPSKVLINDFNIANRGPEPPQETSWTITTSGIRLSWSTGLDSEPNMLSYNVRVGSTPGSNDILACECNEPFRTDGRGNAGYSRSLLLPSLEHGTYYFSVQSVDSALKRSPWSYETCIIYEGEN